MNKKIIKKGLFLGMVLILISAGFVSGLQSLDSDTNHFLNQSFHQNNIQIINHYSNNPFLANNFVLMEQPISLEDRQNKQITVTNIETPDEFSWTSFENKDWTTCAKNQGDCGSCWLFAAMGALESVINIRENCSELNPDLSEQYVLSCLPEAGSCYGGNVDRCVYYYIMNTSASGYYHNGVITEECFNYQSNYNYIPPCSDKIPDWIYYLVPILDYEEAWPNLNDPTLKDTMKSLIFEKGPIMVYFWASDRFIRWGGFHKDPTEYYPDNDENCPNYVNHGMTIVGWKDDANIENGGYWICKNTWGPNWGYKGFFNIEYDCLNVGGFIAWVDYNPESYDWPPVANANGFYQGHTNEELIFDGSNSVDAEGNISSYLWDFGDDTTQNGPIASHIYNESGVYPVNLTVVDDSGQQTSQITLAGIDEDPILVDISGGLGFTISFDNPVDIELSNLEYNINIKGLVIPNKISGIYQSIPADSRVETKCSVFGIGFGSIQLSIENFSRTANIFIFGPFVKVFNLGILN